MKKEENKGGLKQSAGSETSVAELMKQNSFLTLLPNNRIQCDVTGHELPLDVEQIKAHISASKFKKALEWYKYDYSPFLPYIVPHKSNNKKLFCTLTKQELNKIPKEVEKHVNGKRFLRLKAEHEAKASKKPQKQKQEDDEEPDFWMPPEESEESEREEEVGSDLDEESADEAEQDDDQPNSKPSRDIALKPAKRKAVKVDENFPVIKRAKVTKGSR